MNSKLKRKEHRDKYWKLPADERLHYDSCMKEISKDFALDFVITKIAIISMIFFTSLIFLASFAIDFSLNTLIELLRPIALIFYKLIIYAMIMDFGLWILGWFIEIKRRREINERFKLK